MSLLINLAFNIRYLREVVYYFYIRQVNGVKLADILFSLLCDSVSVCAHAVQSSLNPSLLPSPSPSRGAPP